MKYAIGRLTTADGTLLLGTAFAISSNLALTAFHCVGDRHADVVVHPEIILHFRSCTVTARVERGGAAADAALLMLGEALPPSERPVSLGSDCWPHERWYSIGFPAAATPTDRGWTGGFALTGWVSEPDSGYLPVPTVQLHCDQSAASQPLELEGLSGAPVLIGRPPRAVGLIRWNLDAGPSVRVAKGAAVFAAPVSAISTLYPGVDRLLLPARDPSLERDNADEKALMDALPLARGGRLRRVGQLTVAAAVIALVLLGGSGSVVAAQAIKSGSSPDAAAAPDASAGPLTTSAPPTRKPTSRPAPTPSATGPKPSPPSPATPVPSPTPRPVPSRTGTTPLPPRVDPPVVSQPSCDDTRLVISPSSGPVGTVIRFTGTCYQPGERVVIRFQTTIISQPNADSQGSIAGSAPVPTTYRDFPTGDYTLSASGRSSVKTDVQRFELTES